jgi:hypothetical protein
VIETPAARYTSPETVLPMDSNIPDISDNYQIPSGSGYPSGWWMIAILALLLVFILQYGYFMRNKLALHVVLRPWLEQLCKVAECEIPMRKDVKRIILINREIRSATDNKNILQVNLTLKNIATFVQPFPKIQLTFSDISGNKIAYRRFVPDEYLSKQIDITKGMKPQVPVIAGLQILDPGKNAVTFVFEFF